jgi:hypothetical protein
LHGAVSFSNREGYLSKGLEIFPLTAPFQAFLFHTTVYGIIKPRATSSGIAMSPYPFFFPYKLSPHLLTESILYYSDDGLKCRYARIGLRKGKNDLTYNK